MRIANNLTELIGKTPLMRLNNFAEKHKLLAQIIDKLEYFNYLGSVKDRAGIALIVAAEAAGKLKPSSVICDY